MRKEVILEHVLSSDVFALAVQNAFNHIIITDTEGHVIYANSAVERITGYTPEEVLGQTPRLWGQQMDSAVYKELWKTIKVEKKPFRGELVNKRKNGDTYTARAVISPILDAKKNLIGFIGTEEDITKEKEVDRMKTEFISIAAHQLLTPLTGMRWGFAILQKSKTLAKEQMEVVHHLSESNVQLINLVSLLLNITRLESGRMSISPQPTDISQRIKELQMSMESDWRQKNLTISIVQHNDVPLISTDPQLLHEICKNLLSNAIKYTPDRGTIDIRITQKSNEVVIVVADSGIGIPKEEQKHIFQKFYRAENARDAKKDGTGLGLYFLKMMVEACSGKVWFESTEGKGTTFSVALPLKGVKEKKGDVTLTKT